MLQVKKHMECHHIVIESSPGVFYSGPVGSFILPERRRRVRQLDGDDIKKKEEVIKTNENEIKVTMCQTNDCQTNREMQLKENGQSGCIQDKRKQFAKKEWKSLNIGEDRGKKVLEHKIGLSGQRFLDNEFQDHSAKTEAVILRRDSMRHIGDWFYPEGGWGWRVVISSMIINILSMGLIMSAGQVLVLSINTRVGDQTDQIKTALVVSGCLSSCQLFSPVIMSFCLQKSPRLAAVIGGLVMALGWLFTSFATQLHQIVISYSFLLGVGCCLVQSSSTVMIGEYFKKRRLHLEIIYSAFIGLGVSLMSVVSFFLVSGLGWRLGLHAIAGMVTSTSLLAALYRPASLYHPQRRAITHLKQHMRLQRACRTKHKQKTILDTSVLRSRTVRMILLSAAVCGIGQNAPFFLVASQARSEKVQEVNILWIQVALGLGYSCGCYLFGRLLIIKSIQYGGCLTKYVCQLVLLVCGLGMVFASLVTRSELSGQLVFVITYGVFSGGCATTLKVFVYKTARSRFAMVWSLVQMVQALPNCGSVALIAFINQNSGHSYGFIIGGVSAILTSICLFLITLDRSLRKRDGKELNKDGTCKKHSLEDRDEMSLKYLENIGAINGSNICDMIGEDFNDTKNNGLNNYLHNISSCNKVSKNVLLDEYEHNVDAALQLLFNMERESEYFCNILQSTPERRKRRFST